MLLLLLLVTPLVNAGDESCSTACMCTLPQPLEMINSIECLLGTWYGKYCTDPKEACYSETRTHNGDKTMNVTGIDIRKNGCSLIYYGTIIIGPSNTLTYTYPCRCEWNGDYVLLATDCKTYRIYGICNLGSCEPDYYIHFSTNTPSDCTMNQVKEVLTKLGLCFDKFTYLC